MSLPWGMEFGFLARYTMLPAIPPQPLSYIEAVFIEKFYVRFCQYHRNSLSVSIPLRSMGICIRNNRS